MCNLVIPVAFLAILNLLQCVLGGDTTLSEWTEAPVVFPFKTSRIACGYNSATDEFWASGGPDGAKLLSYNIGCDNLTEFADVSEQIFTEGSPFTQYNNTLFFADDSHLGSLDMDTGEFNYNISRKLNLRGYSTCLETSPDGRYIFLIGGHTNANGIESRAYLYDLELGIITTGSQFNNQGNCCSARSCNVIGDRLYVFGGWKRYYDQADFIEYLDISDLSTFAGQLWVIAPFTMINASQMHQTVVFNDYVYKFGVSTGPTDEIERYDVQSGTAEPEGRLFPQDLTINTFCAVTTQDRIVVAVVDGSGGKLFWASKDGDTVPTACGPTRAPTGVTGEPSSVTEAPTGRPTADQTTSTALWTTAISTTDLFWLTTSNPAVDGSLSAQDSAVDNTMMAVAISLGVLLVFLLCAAAVYCFIINRKRNVTSDVGNLEAMQQDAEPAQHEYPVELVSACTEIQANPRSISSLYEKESPRAGIPEMEEDYNETPGITRVGSEGMTAEGTRSPSVVEGRVSVGGEGKSNTVRNETVATRD